MTAIPVLTSLAYSPCMTFSTDPDISLIKDSMQPEWWCQLGVGDEYLYCLQVTIDPYQDQVWTVRQYSLSHSQLAQHIHSLSTLFIRYQSINRNEIIGNSAGLLELNCISLLPSSNDADKVSRNPSVPCEARKQL